MATFSNAVLLSIALLMMGSAIANTAVTADSADNETPPLTAEAIESNTPAEAELATSATDTELISTEDTELAASPEDANTTENMDTEQKKQLLQADESDNKAPAAAFNYDEEEEPDEDSCD